METIFGSSGFFKFSCVKIKANSSGKAAGFYGEKIWQFSISEAEDGITITENIDKIFDFLTNFHRINEFIGIRYDSLIFRLIFYSFWEFQ